MKFEENWQRGYRGGHSKVWMDGRRMDSRGRMASDQIAHPESCSGELKRNKSEKKIMTVVGFIHIHLNSYLDHKLMIGYKSFFHLCGYQ